MLSAEFRNATQGVPYNDTGRTHNHVGDGALDIPFVGRDVLDAPHLISAKLLNAEFRNALCGVPGSLKKY